VFPYDFVSPEVPRVVEREMLAIQDLHLWLLLYHDLELYLACEFDIEYA
jgi:hypothetical protein